MASLGAISFHLEVSRLNKAELRIPYLSWGAPKVWCLRAENRQLSVSGCAGEEGLEVSPFQRELVQKNLSQIAEKREAISSIKLEEAITVQQELIDVNSSSNLHVDATETKPSEIPFLLSFGNFCDRAKEPVQGDIGLLKPANLDSTSIAPSQDSNLRVSEMYETKNGQLEDLIEPNAISLSFGDDVAPEKDSKPSLPLAGVNAMSVILVAAECGPWSKTGGLGDVAGALPKALAVRGHRVMVVVPKYGDYPEPKDTGVRKMYKVDGQDMEVSYYHAYIDGVDFVFLECWVFRHWQHNIYGGDRLEVLKRMILFCKAAVEVPWHVPCGGVCYGDGNLVFIANDWHTALLPVYLKAYYRDHGVMKYARSVLVIHNIAHQLQNRVRSVAEPG